MKLAKRCPICNGEPQYVHYCIPGSMEESDGLCMLLKRLECKECGATVPELSFTCDEAVEYWNEVNLKTGKRYILQRAMTELCSCEKE